MLVQTCRALSSVGRAKVLSVCGQIAFVIQAEKYKYKHPSRDVSNDTMDSPRLAMAGVGLDEKGMALASHSKPG